MTPTWLYSNISSVNVIEEWNLTPANQRCQTPGQRVDPDAQDGQEGSAFGVPLDSLQWFGDDQVSIDRDGQQVYHRADAKQRTTECIYFTSWTHKQNIQRI